MKRTLKQWVFTGLALGAVTASSFAGERVVRYADGWTVTIRPARSGSELADRVPDQRTSAQPDSSDSTRVRSGVVIRPVSFEQSDAIAQELPALASEPAPALAPAPGEVVLQRDTIVTPALSTELSPAPPVDSPYKLPESRTNLPTMELPLITPRLREPETNPTIVVPQTANYRDIYFSIPFIRAEYNANPSYRHEATMEFLFNQMRPTVIQRGTTNVYNYDYGYGSGNWDQPYYPYSYGLRIHRSR